MRIIIEIDGGNMTGPTVHSYVTAAASRDVPAVTAVAGATAPPELPSAAASLGTTNAGPAPALEALSSTAEIPAGLPGWDAFAAGLGDIDAGPAPDGPTPDARPAGENE